MTFFHQLLRTFKKKYLQILLKEGLVHWKKKWFSVATFKRHLISSMYDLFLLIHKKNPMHLILKKHCKKKSLVFNAKFPPCQIHSPIYVRWECRWAYSSKLSTWFHASFTRNTPHNFMVCAWPNVSFPKFQHTYISQSKIPFFLLACLFQKYGATFEAYISSSTNPEIVRGRSHLELHINDIR